jgi:hypothetical protein
MAIDLKKFEIIFILFDKIFRWRIDFNLIWNKKKYFCPPPPTTTTTTTTTRTTLRPVGFAAGKNSQYFEFFPG